MGFGVTSTSALLTLGLYPQVASAAVHMAEIFTSLVSGAAHYKLGNVKREITLPLTITGIIGGVAGFLDAIGGGWEPIATSNWVLDENIKPNEAVGSVNFAEFFQTIFVSITFFILLPELDWNIILSLTLGGLVIAPFAALFAKKISHKPLGIDIGATVILLSINNIMHIFPTL